MILLDNATNMQLLIKLLRASLYSLCFSLVCFCVGKLFDDTVVMKSYFYTAGESHVMSEIGSSIRVLRSFILFSMDVFPPDEKIIIAHLEI